MKRYLLLIWLLYSAVFNLLKAQNLIANPSFENVMPCPDYISQLGLATPWNTPSQGTPDLFNACSSVESYMNVPENSFGYQVAADGNGYAGFYASYNAFETVMPPTYEYREYLQCLLTTPLEIGKEYHLSFSVSLCDNSHFGVSEIGAILREDYTHIEITGVLDDLVPTVSNPENNILVNKDGWSKIEGCFTADKAYAYLIVGCYVANPDLHYQLTGSSIGEYYAYYYVDDFSLEEVHPPPALPDITACDTDMVELRAQSGCNEYLWSTGASGISILVNEGGLYWIRQQLGGCVYSDTVEVNLMPIPVFDLGPDTVIDFCESGGDTLGVAYDPGWTYSWSDGSTDTLLRVTREGDFSLWVTNQFGCKQNDMVSYYNSCNGDIFIPTCFTPNNDGKNDLFEVFLYKSDSFSLKIFDRWGNEVFFSDNPAQPWDGGHTDFFCVDGVYNYRVEWTVGKSFFRRTGHLALLR